jgi:hypothetical protein
VETDFVQDPAALVDLAFYKSLGEACIVNESIIDQIIKDFVFFFLGEFEGLQLFGYVFDAPLLVGAVLGHFVQDLVG